jgi:hypothetical protein
VVRDRRRDRGRGRAGAGTGGADAGDDDADDAGGGRQARELGEHEQPGQQCDGRLQAHQCAEGAGRQPPQREELQGERDDRVQHGQGEHDAEQRPGQPAETGRYGAGTAWPRDARSQVERRADSRDGEGEGAGHRQGDGQPV